MQAPLTSCSPQIASKSGETVGEDPPFHAPLGPSGHSLPPRHTEVSGQEDSTPPLKAHDGAAMTVVTPSPAPGAAGPQHCCYIKGTEGALGQSQNDLVLT